MKANMHELDNAFYLELFSEDQEEDHILIRFGLNATKERVLMGANIGKKTGAIAWISVSKRKQEIFAIKA